MFPLDSNSIKISSVSNVFSSGWLPQLGNTGEVQETSGSRIKNVLAIQTRWDSTSIKSVNVISGQVLLSLLGKYAVPTGSLNLSISSRVGVVACTLNPFIGAVALLLTHFTLRDEDHGSLSTASFLIITCLLFDSLQFSRSQCPSGQGKNTLALKEFSALVLPTRNNCVIAMLIKHSAPWLAISETLLCT